MAANDAINFLTVDLLMQDLEIVFEVGH